MEFHAPSTHALAFLHEVQLGDVYNVTMPHSHSPNIESTTIYYKAHIYYIIYSNLK